MRSAGVDGVVIGVSGGLDSAQALLGEFDRAMSQVLLDVLDTEISPELVPDEAPAAAAAGT